MLDPEDDEDGVAAPFESSQLLHLDLSDDTDRLMRHIGLKSHRKGGLWSDLISPYLATDFKDIKDEYMSTIGPE